MQESIQQSESTSTKSKCGTCSQNKPGGCSANARDDGLSAKLKKQNDLNEEIQKILRKVDNTEKNYPKNNLNGYADSATLIFEDNKRINYSIDLDKKLELASELSHRYIDSKHLWIAVHEGTVVVLNDMEHGALTMFQTGAKIRLILENPLFERESVINLIGKLATAGFIKGIEGYKERHSVIPHRFARFHITKFCNLSCIHCYADSSPLVDRSNEKPTDWWKALIDKFAKHEGEKILFTGGEALTHPGCIDLLKHSKDVGLYTTLFSNGLLINRDAEKIRGLCNEIQISLDGPDAETNDPIRGKGTFLKITKAIDTLLEHGDARVRVGMCVMEDNWDAWQEKFKDFSKRYANTGLEFKLSFGLIPHGRGEVKNDALRAAHTQAIVEELLSGLPGPGGDQNGPRVARAKSSCGYAEQLVVSPDGTVHPCHLLDAPLCHIDDKPYEEIINLLKGVSKAFEVDNIEGCKHCDIRYLCGGTCRVVNGTMNGTRFINTCNSTEKHRKLQNLVRYFG